MKLRQNEKKKTSAAKIILIASACAAVLACAALLIWGGGARTPEQAAQPRPSDAPAQTPEPAEPENARLLAAREKNKDVIGWLTLEGAEIDDPVVQGGDNDFYLRRRWDEEGYDVWGCYFLDYINVIDARSLFDRVSIIYGHALDDSADGERFSKLKRYNSAEFCAAHPEFTLELAEGKLTIEIFSACEIPVSYDYIDPNPGDEKLQAILDYMLANSSYDFGVDAGADDTLLILSTCTSDESVRYVVAGRVK